MMDVFFTPNSIAVIGASQNPKKIGHAILNNLLRFGFKGKIFPMNPSAREILGFKTYPALTEVMEDIGLAVIVIPALRVPGALVECGKAGVKSAVIISAGFKESGLEGMRLEEDIKRIAKENHIRILGPNCLGVINTSHHLNATFAAGMLPEGRMSFFSQSGALGIAVLDWAIGNKIGFSKFISLGNKADLNEIDFLDYFRKDPETDVILGYIEDVVIGRRFLEVAKETTRTKPVILLKAGGTEAGARAASSHTGALAGSETAFDAAFRQTGIIRAEGIEDLFDIALSFSGRRLPSGRKLLIVTNAGGPGIIAADASERLGLELPMLSKESVDAVRPLLPPNASIYNPVDLIGDAPPERYRVVLNQAIHDPHVNGLLVIVVPQATTDVGQTTDLIIHTAEMTDRPVIASLMGEASVRGSIEKLEANAIPNFSYPEIAVKGFKRLCDYFDWKNLNHEEPICSPFDRGGVKDKIDNFLKTGRYQMGEDEGMAILSQYGFVFPKKGLAVSSKEASRISAKMGFPVVMKISSPDILHKTDVGGVKLNIASRREAEDAFMEITSNVRRFMPDAFIRGVMIYEMVRGGREVILGVTYDRTFGHMIMFGLGGIYVEVLKDVSFRIIPVTRREVLSMINETKSSALLRGTRGEKPVDIEAIVEGILNLSCLITDFPSIRELDLNPLVVMEKGAVALDTRIVFSRSPT
jgi:acetyl coenzyme A synthetase (ADP forming)-like protein